MTTFNGSWSAALGGLASCTPALKAAIEIGIEATQYDGEGQCASAYDRYEMALQKIVQLLSLEPKGRRKELLYQQVRLFWVGFLGVAFHHHHHRMRPANDVDFILFIFLISDIV